MQVPDWSHPNPIFCDFETMSACKIDESGGRLYANHPSTRILMLVFTDGDDNASVGVYIPDSIRVRLPDRIAGTTLWPHYLKPARKVNLYRGPSFPDVLLDRIKEGTPLVAHNAYMFDRFIWNRFCDTPAQWLDSLLLARASGKPGRLDALSKAILGVGKDHAKTLLPKLTTATVDRYNLYGDSISYVYPTLNTGDFLAFLRYAVADVELIRRIWESEFEHLSVEADVIACNDEINELGILVDRDLLDGIVRVSEYSVASAMNEITRLTKDTAFVLHGNPGRGNIRSGPQMHEWLNSFGITIVDDDGKPCLRKEIVQRYIDSPYIIEEHLTSAKEIPPLVIKVLQLRMKALRITDAKLERAKERLSLDGRIRDLHSYHVAGTGRFSSSGVQIHNLPRPIREIDIEKLLTEVNWKDTDSRNLFDSIKAITPEYTKEGKPITVDDVCSAMVRPMFIPKKGHVFAIADFSQIEARLAAWAAGETKLTNIFTEGRDPYKEFASKFFGVPLEEVTELQRQVAKSAILGAQYSIGPDKLRVYAANMGADLQATGVTAEQLVEGYRNEYTKICGFKPNKQQNFRTNGVWQNLDKVVKTCVETGEPGEAAKCRFFKLKKDLCCELPSGRIIYYPDARIEDVIPPYVYTLGLPHVPKATVQYTSNRGPKSLYGGLEFENVIQAMGRDLLAYALVLIRSKGIDIPLDVHDEIVGEVPEKEGPPALREMVTVMSTPPNWCKDLPLECEGYLAPRFIKKPFKGWLKLSTKDIHGTDH